MTNTATTDAGIDLLALFAEVEADRVANPAKWAALAAAADAPSAPLAKAAGVCSCRRCGGTGKYGPYYIERGTCFDCGGSGVER